MVILVCERATFFPKGLYTKRDIGEPSEIMEKLSSKENAQFYIIGTEEFAKFVNSLTKRPTLYLGEEIKEEFKANFKYIIFRLGTDKFVVLEKQS